MPILWIPAHLGQPVDDRRVAEPTPMNFIVLQLGYEDLFGEPSNWEAVRDRLSRYSLRAVLDIVARISAFLKNVEGEQREREAQKRIFDGLFGEAGAPAWQRAGDERRRNPDIRSVMLFGELQLINVVKVALLCMPVEDRASQESLKELGEALLMISDLMWSQLEPAVPSHRGAPIPPAWQQMLLANHLYHSGGTFRNDLARSYDLYLRDRPELRAHIDYVDLPVAAQRLTGMDSRTLWAVLFAMGAHWRTIDEDGLYRLRAR